MHEAYSSDGVLTLRRVIAGASSSENDIFYSVLAILSFGVILLILKSVYEIPTWNQNHNYLDVMTQRVADVKSVGELKLPALRDLIKSSVGNRDKVTEICNVLASHGCGDTTDLLHYMQSCTFPALRGRAAPCVALTLAAIDRAVYPIGSFVRSRLCPGWSVCEDVGAARSQSL